MGFGSIAGREKVIGRRRGWRSIAFDFGAETAATGQGIRQEGKVSSGAKGQDGKKDQYSEQDSIRGLVGDVKTHDSFSLRWPVVLPNSEDHTVTGSGKIQWVAEKGINGARLSCTVTSCVSVHQSTVDVIVTKKDLTFLKLNMSMTTNLNFPA
jgi:hypothetical protein